MIIIRRRRNAYTYIYIYIYTHISIIMIIIGYSAEGGAVGGGCSGLG